MLQRKNKSLKWHKAHILGLLKEDEERKAQNLEFA